MMGFRKACLGDRARERTRIAGEHAGDLDRVAVVFRQPLPYLYLAAETLGAAGLPYVAADALPLAAEPTIAKLFQLIWMKQS
mgnify:CR=1 FL=1